MPQSVALTGKTVHGGGRLKFDAELIASNKGVWNNTLRRLHISNWRPHQWGYEATSTVFEDCWPNFSGASLMSFFSSFEADLDVYVDEVLPSSCAINFSDPLRVNKEMSTRLQGKNAQKSCSRPRGSKLRACSHGSPARSGVTECGNANSLMEEDGGRWRECW